MLRGSWIRPSYCTTSLSRKSPQKQTAATIALQGCTVCVWCVFSLPYTLRLLTLRLFLEKLPKHHPEYNKPEYKVDRAKIKKLVKEAFPRAEELKKKLISRFDAEKDALEQKHAANVCTVTTFPSSCLLYL